METALDQYGVQSSLITAGEQATAIYGLTFYMTLAFSVVFIGVMLLIWFAWRRTAVAGHWWVWSGGVILPVFAILTLLVASTATLVGMTRSSDDALVIQVTGHQFWWDVIYDPEDRQIRDANEIFLPARRPVEFHLKSNDVIHSLWIPSISGKMDMIPGRTNVLRVTATEPGRYRGQCAEFCGLSHPKMAFEVVVVTQEKFDEWLTLTAGEARDAARPELLAGRQVFLDAGCAACHAIRGVAEGARIGPDLTRVGDRGSLGAGMWRMNQGNLAGWIADVGDMKPGAQMPSYNNLSGPDLRALSAYLGSLKNE